MIAASFSNLRQSSADSRFAAFELSSESFNASFHSKSPSLYKKWTLSILRQQTSSSWSVCSLPPPRIANDSKSATNQRKYVPTT